MMTDSHLCWSQALCTDDLLYSIPHAKPHTLRFRLKRIAPILSVKCLVTSKGVALSIGTSQSIPRALIMTRVQRSRSGPRVWRRSYHFSETRGAKLRCTRVKDYVASGYTWSGRSVFSPILPIPIYFSRSLGVGLDRVRATERVLPLPYSDCHKECSDLLGTGRPSSLRLVA